MTISHEEDGTAPTRDDEDYENLSITEFLELYLEAPIEQPAEGEE